MLFTEAINKNKSANEYPLALLFYIIRGKLYIFKTKFSFLH